MNPTDFERALKAVNNDGRALRHLIASKHPKLLAKAQRRAKDRNLELRQCIYDLVYSIRSAPVCTHESCKNKVPYMNYVDGYGKYCSRTCANSSDEKRIKVKATLNRKYGVDNISQIDAVKKKRVRTFKKRYGTDNPSKCEEVKKKIMRTHEERYGGHYMATAGGKERHRAAVMSSLGVANPSHSPDVLAKIRETTLRNYGVDNAMKSPVVKKRAQKTTKARYGTEHHVNSEDYKRRMKETIGVDHPWKLESHIDYNLQRSHAMKDCVIAGATYRCRGYEHHALRYMIEERGVKPGDIANTVAAGLPKFRYVDSDGKEKRYYPDIYAKIGNKWWVVEVKSTYTVGATNESYFRTTQLKARTVKNAGYRFMLLVFDSRGTLLVKSTDFHRLTHRKLVALLS